jgi:hypothetical protein
LRSRPDGTGLDARARVEGGEYGGWRAPVVQEASAGYTASKGVVKRLESEEDAGEVVTSMVRCHSSGVMRRQPVSVSTSIQGLRRQLQPRIQYLAHRLP